jgi:hypothetical protein
MASFNPAPDFNSHSLAFARTIQGSGGSDILTRRTNYPKARKCLETAHHPSPFPLPSSACVYVAQICNRPYRRFVIGGAPEISSALALAGLPQNAILRYSRLQICATRPRRALDTYPHPMRGEGGRKPGEGRVTGPLISTASAVLSLSNC